MRWMHKNTILKGREGEKRTIEKFLLLPMCLPNKKGREEWRWLEKVSIDQVVGSIEYWKYFWQNVQWGE